MMGLDTGLEDTEAAYCEIQLAQGATILAARVHSADTSQTHGTLIESGASKVFDLEGRFM